MPTPPTKPPIDPAVAAAETEAKKKAGEKPLGEDSPSAKFLRDIIGGQPKKPEPKKKPETDEGDEPEPKPAPKKKPAAPPAPVIDENKLGAAIGRSLAEHTKGEAKAKSEEQERDKPKPTAKEEAEARRIAVLEHMESTKPERYKGLAGLYKANQAKLKSRVATWEKDHPGESYADMLEAYEADPDSHPEFADEAKFTDDLDAQADWEDEDYEDARVDLRADKKLEEKLAPREAKLDERISEVERAEKLRSSGRQLAEVAYAAGNDCWEEMGEEFAGVVNKDGSINGEALTAINKADPVKHDIAVSAAKAAELGAMKIHALANGLEKNDPENPHHAAINKFAYDMEQRMLERAADKQLDDEGRAFCTKRQYDAMPAEQRSRHWVFTPDQLKALWVHDVAKRAKADLQAEDEKFSRRAKARGLIHDEEEPAARTAKRPQPRRNDSEDGDDSTGDDNAGKPESPAFSLSPKLSAGKGGRSGGSENAVTRFVKDVFA